MGNSLGPAEPVEYITFVCETTGAQAKIPWSVLASKFKRFEDPMYRNSNVITTFPMRSFRRLAEVLQHAGMALMNEEDIRLLNWLQLRDFTDGYKLYGFTASSPFAPPVPISENTAIPVDDDGNVAYFKRM